MPAIEPFDRRTAALVNILDELEQALADAQTLALLIQPMPQKCPPKALRHWGHQYEKSNARLAAYCATTLGRLRNMAERGLQTEQENES